MGTALKEKIVKGVVWSATERFSVQGIQFTVGIIIARLVTPSEYGLIAMLGIFITIANLLLNSGFSNALIQKKDRTDTDYSTAFYFHVIMSAIIYTGLFITAPCISRFYNEPRLTDITRWIGLTIIISAFSIVQQAKLSIMLDFRTQAKALLISVIISGTAGICLAYDGYGVWALIVQTLLNQLLNAVLLGLFLRWTPLAIFSWSSFKALFSFGSKLMIGGILHNIYMNLYTLIIGRYFSSNETGLFGRAQSFAIFPANSFTDIITRAVFPALCSIQDEEERLAATFISSLRMVVFIVFPVMTALSILSEPLIALVLTDKWLAAAPFLSVLCLSFMWYPVMSVNWQILNVRGRSDLSLKSEIIKKAVAVSILIATIPLGIKGLCWGLILYSIADIVIVIYFVKKVIPVGYTTETANILPFLVTALLMGAGIYGVIQLLSASPLLTLIAGTVTGIALYAGLSALFRLPEFFFCLKKIKQIVFHKK